MTPANFALNFALENQVIIITGAAGYLGEAISKGVAASGGIPILCGRTINSLNKLSEDIQSMGKKALAFCLDVTQVEECQKLILHISKMFGRLDGIVNCAHSGRTGTIESALPQDFDLAQKVHVAGPFFLVQAALELLKNTAKNKKGGTSIVNIASMYGQVSPDPGIYGNSGSNNPPYYGAAKAGLIQLTRYLATHLGPYNIRVNSLCPGPFPPDEIKENNPAFHEKLCIKNPLGRIGEANEVAGPVIFLLSAASSYVTGANLAVDGGWTCW